MTSHPEWIDEAHRLRQEGLSYQSIARRLGRSKFAVRCAVAPGEAERQAARNARRKARRIEHFTIPQISGPRCITLPAVSIQAAPIDEIAQPRRIAPKAHLRSESPRIATIREIHHRMIRAGKIAGPDLLSEMRT